MKNILKPPKFHSKTSEEEREKIMAEFKEKEKEFQMELMEEFTSIFDGLLSVLFSLKNTEIIENHRMQTLCCSFVSFK